MSQCPVCGGEEDVVSHTCRIKPFKDKTMRGHQCRSCKGCGATSMILTAAAA